MSKFNFFIISGIIFLIFSSVLAIDFAQHDDYYYFVYDNKTNFLNHPQYDFFNLVGRQLYNLIAWPMAWMTHNIHELMYIRIFEIGLLSISIFLLFNYLKKLGLPTFLAISTVLLIATLPGLQVGVLWITMGPFFVSMLCGILSGVFLQSFNLNQSIWSILNLARLLSSFVLLLIAFFIYQPWAMLFLLPMTAYLLFNKQNIAKDCIIRLFLTAIILILAMCSYYFIHKFIYLPNLFSKHPQYKALYQQLGTYQFSLDYQLLTRFFEIFKNYLYQVIGPWDIYNSGWGLTIASTFLICGFICKCIEWRLNTGKLGKLSLNILLICGYLGLLFASTIPCIASPEIHIFSRTLLPINAIIVLGLIWSDISIINFLQIISKKIFNKTYSFELLNTIILILILFCICISAFKNTRDSANNDNIELSIIKNKIFSYVNKNGLPNQIHVVTAKNPNSYLNLPQIRDEFNFRSANFPDGNGMIRSVLLEIFANRKNTPMSNIPIVYDDSIQKPIQPKTLIIDMNDYFYFVKSNFLQK